MLGTYPDDSHSPGLPDEEYTGRDELPSTIPAKRQRQRRTTLACTGSQEHDNSASTSIHQSRLLARDSISLPQRSNSNDQPPAQAAPHHSPLRASAPAPHSAASHLPQRRVEQPTATRDHSSSAMDGQHDKEEDGDFAAGVALLSLNSASEPHFLGASSGSTWAKLVSSVWRRPGISLYHTNPIRSGQSHGTPSDVSENQLQPHQCLLPSPGDSEILFKACYMHVQARYAFPDWIELRRWISQQESLLRASVENDVNTPEGKVSRVAMFFILMVYSVGSRLMQATPVKVSTAAAPEAYYASALCYMEVIMMLHDIHHVQALLWLIMYSIRCSEGPSAWHLIGMAMRMALELGMHRRRKRPFDVTPYHEEVRKRTWWALYGIDRWFSLTLGRPFGIDDRDTDQFLPADINCDVQITETPPSAPFVSESPPGPSQVTSMSSAIHMFRLRRIESQIQRYVYAVQKDDISDMGLTSPSSTASVSKWQPVHESLLEQVERWKKMIPKQNNGLGSQPLPCCEEDYFQMKAETTKLLILRPFSASAKSGDRVLSLCGHAAASLCEMYRRVHRRYPATHSLCLADLHGIFLTGLTLLSVLSIDRKALPASIAHRALRACSTSLFIYAQHYPVAEPFRDAFEDLATACSDDSNEPPDPITYQSAIRFANDGPYASRGDRSAPIDLHPTFGGIVSSDGPTSDSSRDRNSHIFNLSTTDQATRMSIDDSSLDCGEAASHLGMSIAASARTQRPSNPQNQSTNHMTFDEHNICPEMRNLPDGRPTREETFALLPNETLYPNPCQQGASVDAGNDSDQLLDGILAASHFPVPPIDRTRPGPESGYQPTVNQVLDQLLSANFYDGFAADNCAEESFSSEIPFDYLSWTNE
nr:hypothetical protein I308_05450 [Cryptococcus tetragattii IND107]